LTTPASTISASDVNTENEFTSTRTMSFNDKDVRDLAGVTAPESQISMASLQSRTRVINISSPVQNLNVYNQLIASGWNGIARPTVYISAGVYIWSDNTSLPGMETGGPFPNGVKIVNSGYIIGRGGDGVQATSYGEEQTTGYGGNPGGYAVNISSSGVIIVNNPGAFIAGGGGGGASGWKRNYLSPGVSVSPPYGPGVNVNGGGGGAGGGIGGTCHLRYAISTNPMGAGGAGGAIGQRGKDGVKVGSHYSGGGGGRILPGSPIVGSTTYAGPPGAAGYYTAVLARTAGIGWGGEAGGGAGGTASPLYQDPVTGNPSQWYSPVARAGGGNGGAPGYPGAYPQGPGTSTFNRSWYDGASGGGWGAPGGIAGWAEGDYTPSRGWDGAPGARGLTAGGTGGKAIALNGYAVTQTNNGTIYGAVA